MGYRSAMYRTALMLALALVPAACHKRDANVPGDSSDPRPYAGIAENDTLRFTGTEPFWGGQATGRTLTYTTPEKQEGWTIPVARFGGRGGLSYSGTLEGKSFDMMVTPGQCSDGMSDRSYPFAVMLKLGDEVRNGCGWTDARPFTGPKTP